MFGSELITSELIWSWWFLLQKITNCLFNVFNIYRPIQIVYFFLFEFWRIVPFKEFISDIGL